MAVHYSAVISCFRSSVAIRIGPARMPHGIRSSFGTIRDFTAAQLAPARPGGTNSPLPIAGSAADWREFPAKPAVNHDRSRSPAMQSANRLKVVLFGEPKSIRRNLPSAQVNGNARPGNWPGVFISLCWQRVTALPPPTPALSIPQARFRGPKETMTVAPARRKNSRELSDSLVNRSSRVNSRVAFGTSSDFELAGMPLRTVSSNASGSLFNRPG